MGQWSLVKVSETSSQTSHVSHAYFFPFPWKADTASHPVKAWKYRIPLAFSGPTAESNSLTGIHQALTPCPKSVHMLWRPSCCRDGSTNTLMITTSVSLAFMMRDLQSSCVASQACTNILVSASSVSWIFFMACLRVATEWAWSRSKCSSDVMLTSNGWLLLRCMMGCPYDTDCIVHTLWERHLFQPGIFLLQMTPDRLRCWVWQASCYWRIWILGDESRSDICEGIGELWNFLHLHICIEFDWLTFLTKLFWTWMIEDGNAGPMEWCLCCSGSWIMVIVVDRWSCKQLLSQDWWTDYSIFHILSYDCLSKLGWDFQDPGVGDTEPILMQHINELPLPCLSKHMHASIRCKRCFMVLGMPMDCGPFLVLCKEVVL